MAAPQWQARMLRPHGPPRAKTLPGAGIVPIARAAPARAGAHRPCDGAWHSVLVSALHLPARRTPQNAKLFLREP